MKRRRWLSDNNSSMNVSGTPKKKEKKEKEKNFRTQVDDIPSFNTREAVMYVILALLSVSAGMYVVWVLACK